MKTAILIFILLVASFFRLSSQTPTKFFSDTCYWFVYDQYWIMYSAYNNFDYQKLQGVTLYNGNVYQKYFQKKYTNTNTPINPNDFIFKGYYMNDSMKVFKGSYLDSMKLIYDFNLTVQDSFLFKGHKNDPNIRVNFYVKVSLVDSVFLGAKWRKRITFKPITSTFYPTVIFKWVDGIGETNYGPIYELSDIQELLKMGGITLNCFTENFAPVIGTCNFVGLSGNVKFENDWQLSPNPATNDIQIQFPNEMIIETPIIFDIDGKKMDCNCKHCDGGNYKMDISNLSSGVYFVFVKTSNGIFRKKLIVQR